MTYNLLVSQQIAFSKLILQALPVANKKQNPLKPFFSCALVGQYFSKWKDRLVMAVRTQGVFYNSFMLSNVTGQGRS